MIPITKRTLADCVLIFLLAAVLIKPLFKLGFTDKWASVEGAIISDARFLSDHWPHPSWQPLWYAGARFDSLFPPAVRYGTVAVAKIARVPMVRAYHTYLAFFYCVGIAAVYFLIWNLSRSRVAAWGAALASALVSPSFLFVAELRNDAWLWVPQRLGALMRYGDGPHIISLAFLPLALAFWWRALIGAERANIVLACVCSALVAANSLAGAAVLIALLPIMLWSIYVTHLDSQIWRRALILFALSWGLSAFWLVPSMVKIAVSNTQFFGPNGLSWPLWIALFVTIVFVQTTNAKFRGRVDMAYVIFASGAALCFAVNVLGYYYFGFQLAGSPTHFVPELDLFLILLMAECLRRSPWRTVAIGVAALALLTSGSYLRRAWHIFPADLAFKERSEYRVQDWAAQHMPDVRMMVAGSPRLWFDAWSDRLQLGGEAESGSPEPLLNAAQFQILRGDQPELGVFWMQILGVDAVVSNKNGKFSSRLPLLWDDGNENAIFQVPRRFPALARVVDTAQWNSLQGIAANNDVHALQGYVEALENGPDVMPLVHGTNVRSRIEPGQSLVIQTMYDSGWHAYSNGKRVPLRRSALGFIQMDPAPGDHDIQMVFETPMEIWLGRLVTLASLIALAVWKVAI